MDFDSNRRVLFKKFIYLFLSATMLLNACQSSGPSEKELLSTSENESTSSPKLTPLETKLPPTSTATATPTETMEPYVEDVAIPECVKGDVTQEVVFSDVMDSLYPHVLELDNFNYRTIYRYLVDGTYPEDELSIELTGSHSGLLEKPGGDTLFFYPLTAQMYEKSFIVQRDLRENSRTEVYFSEQGAWLREPGDPGWLKINNLKQGEFLNFADMLSPSMIFFLLTGGGSLLPGIRTDIPDSIQPEIIGGEDAQHYCWTTPKIYEGISGYLIHYDSIYTFLKDVEVHLWTGAEDTKLLRLIVSGKHDSERLAEEEFLDHETEREFLLWMEINDSSDRIKLNAPPESEVALEISAKKKLFDQSQDSAYVDFPLPKDAIESNLGFLGEETSARLFPREYLWPHYESSNTALEYFSGPSWYRIPRERITVVETNMSRQQILTFYEDKMVNRGWHIEKIYYQIQPSRVFIQYKREQVSLLVIQEDGVHKTSLITAIIPPAEEILQAIISGWMSYDEGNSDLVNNSVTAFAFDNQGKTWIGSKTTGGWFSITADGTSHESPEKAGGISIFDGKDWKNYSTKNSDLLDDDIQAIAADIEGGIWISSSEGLNIINGKTWKNLSNDETGVGLIREIIFDEEGTAWMLGSDGVSSFDGQQWSTYQSLDRISAFDFDLNGRLLVATTDSLYYLDEERWLEIDTMLETHDEPIFENIADMQIDSKGQIWVLTQYGELHVFDGKSWISHHPKDSGFPLNFVQHMVIDQQDRIWVIPFFGRVYMLDQQSGWIDYTPDAVGIFIENPNTLEVDHEGRVWIGSERGIALFTPPD
ncbi:MAG: hypothetical protein JSV42_10810 [Chloroflexota bacterium]|nr:MAG: hypothetical protein JSV42_10810 [Chloroflexota bacterium]